MNQTSLLKCELKLSELHTDLVQKASVPFKRKLFIAKYIHRLFKAGLTCSDLLQDWTWIGCQFLMLYVIPCAFRFQLMKTVYNIMLFVMCLNVNVHMIFWTNDQFKLYFTCTIDFY